MPLNPEGVKCKLLDNTATSTELGIGLYSPLQRTSCETNSWPPPLSCRSSTHTSAFEAPCSGPRPTLSTSLVSAPNALLLFHTPVPATKLSYFVAVLSLPEAPPTLSASASPSAHQPHAARPAPQQRWHHAVSASHSGQPLTALGALALQGTDVRFSASAPESPSSEVFLF